MKHPLTTLQEGPPRVFYFLHEPRYSGPAKRIISSSQELKRAGFSTIIVTPTGPDTIKERCNALGVEHLQVPLAKIPRPSLLREVLSWVWRQPIDAIRLWRLVSQSRPNIAVINGAFFILPGIICKLQRRPLVWYLNDTILPPMLAKLATKLVRVLADEIVTQGNGVAEFHGLEPGEYSSIYSGVDLGQFRYRERSSDFFKGHLRVGLVAQWAPNKGHHHFLAAAKLVRDTLGDRVTFVIAGSRLANQLEYQVLIDHLIDELSLKDCIEEKGFVEDVPALMRELNLLVMASTKGDACSNAILEAMACGVPIVTTTVGSSTELVEGKGLERAGYAVPPGDEKAMADAMVKILSDPEKAEAMSRAARRRVEKNFSLDEYVQKHLSIFEKILMRQY